MLADVFRQCQLVGFDVMIVDAPSWLSTFLTFFWLLSRVDGGHILVIHTLENAFHAPWFGRYRCLSWLLIVGCSLPRSIKIVYFWTSFRHDCNIIWYWLGHVWTLLGVVHVEFYASLVKLVLDANDSMIHYPDPIIIHVVHVSYPHQKIEA